MDLMDYLPSPIKIIKPILVRPITIIINQMLNTRVFPDKLKIAKINPIFKKDDNTLFTNYRPISLLPVISKIFEKVIFQQVYHYFKEKKRFIMHNMASVLNTLQNLQP